MKRPAFGIVLVLLLAFVAGCVNSARQSSAANRGRPRAYALSVTVNGALQPTPMQWAAIQAKFADEFAWRGWVLVTDLSLADYIVRVDFTPDPSDPENNGHAVVIGIRDNPRALLGTLTTLSPYPTSLSYMGSFQSGRWSPGFSNNYYYGWGDSSYDGFSYSSPTLNPVKPPVVTTPPYRHHHFPTPEPGQPGYCPPPTDPTHPHRHYLPGDFAPRPPAQPTYVADLDSFNRPRWSHDSSSRGSSGNSSTRSDSVSSHSDRTSYWRRDRDSNSSSSNSSNSNSSDRTYTRGDWRAEHGYSRSDSSGWRSDRASRSDSGSSRSDSNYSRSDSGNWHSRNDSSSSSSSSYSGSSYSSGSSSSSGSYSSGSSDSSSSGGSSASYSPGSSGSDSGGGGSSHVGGRAQQN